MKKYICHAPIVCTKDAIGHKGDIIETSEDDPYVKTLLATKQISPVKEKPEVSTSKTKN